MGFSFVIEHMEDDDDRTKSVPPWVLLEYQHMRTLAGKENTVRFSHLSSTSTAMLEDLWSPEDTGKANVQVTSIGIIDLMKQEGVGLESVCLLDPKAEKELSPEDGDGRFSWFLFGVRCGGSWTTAETDALDEGDDPPRDRTSELRALGFPGRHLGPVQMTTDTALGVTKMVVCDKVALRDIPYNEFPTIRFNAKESVEMPFRYVKGPDGEPILPPGMRELLKADLDKGFDF